MRRRRPVGDRIVAALDVERRLIGTVPVLMASPQRRSGRLPLVLWFHGLGADKDVHRPELEQVAARGFLAVGVDAAGHGERRLPDLDAHIALARPDVMRMMLGLAATTVSELRNLLATLIDTGAADPRRISAVGISMGGYLVYRAAIIEPAIRTV